MAPISSDPKDLLLVLNPARRLALVQVVGQITSHMRRELDVSFHSSSRALYEIPPPKPPRPQESQRGNAPLFVSKYDAYDAPPREDPEDSRQQPGKLERTVSSPKLHDLRGAALKYFDGWEKSVQGKLKDLMNTPRDPRQKAPPPQQQTQPPPDPAAEKAEADEIAHLQSLYEPVQTRLATVSKQDRKKIISSMLLLLLSLQHYSAHSRVLLCYLTSSLELPLSVLNTEETETAQALLHTSKSSPKSESISASTDTAIAARANNDASSRKWKVGLASVAGAALIGVTGGLAAPVVAAGIGTLMGGVGLGGLASFLGVFAMNGALMGTLFGVMGGKMMGERMEKYTKSVQDFKFVPILDEEGWKNEGEDIENKRLRVTIGVNGWLRSEADIIKPWATLGDDTEAFALRYEMDSLIKLGNSLEDLAAKYAWSYVKFQVLKTTVLATVSAALWPITLLSMAGTLDTPFALAKNRSEKAGAVLADALIHKVQGERPVTLIGYSLGSRVIYSCLRELAEQKAFGLVESVVMIGSPVPSDPDTWRAMKSVVSGKMINVFSENDYILGFMYRATSIQLGVAGLQAARDVAGVKNLDLTEEVAGHLRYPGLIGKILRRAGFANVLVGDDGVIEKEVEEPPLIELDAGTNFDARATAKGNKGNAAPLADLDGRMGAPEVKRDYIDVEGPPVKRITDHDIIDGPDEREVHRDYIEGDSPVIELIDNDGEDEHAHVNKSMGQLHISSRDYDSNESDGGIKMIDNDNDDDDFPNEKMPENTKPIETGANPLSTEDSGIRDAEKMVINESKVLGSLPEVKRKLTASEMGLY